MPFDLRLCSIPTRGGKVWSMDGPSWLDRPRTLPVPPDAIREFAHALTWERERYLLVSRDEIRAWHAEAWPDSRSRENLDEYTAKKLEEFEAEVLGPKAAPLYLMNWYEWESGLG